MYKAIKSYQNVSVESELENASPYRVTQLLMEGCLKFIAQAKGAIERNNYESKSELISKAQAIINTLTLSMKAERNPEVSENLTLLYSYINEQLMLAAATMDISKLDEATKILLQIKAGWDAIPEEVVAEANKELREERAKQP